MEGSVKDKKTKKLRIRYLTEVLLIERTGFVVSLKVCLNPYSSVP